MKKILAFLAISLLLMSSLVQAQALGVNWELTEEQEDEVDENDVPEAKKIAIRTRIQNKVKQLKEIEVNAALSKFKEGKEFKAREIVAVNLEKAKQNYVTAKNRYLTAKQNYDGAKEKFSLAKNKLVACQGGDDSEECKEASEKIKERAKEFLIKTADRILEYLEKLKAKVESNEDLTEEEAEEILADINDMIDEVEAAKETAETSEDKEELKEATKTIKNAWLKIKKRISIHTGRIMNARIGGIIVKIKHLEVKLERILDKMEEEGIDTSDIQGMVDKFNDKIDDAKESYENALDKFREAMNADDVDSAYNLATEGHDYLKKANRNLQDAQKILRNILQEMKQAGGSEALVISDDLVVVEEEETEEEEESELVGETEFILYEGESYQFNDDYTVTLDKVGETSVRVTVNTQTQTVAEGSTEDFEDVGFEVTCVEGGITYVENADDNSATLKMAEEENCPIIDSEGQCVELPLEPEEFCGSSTYYECETDADCKTSGCNGETCQGAAEELDTVSVCVWYDCYDDEAYGVACGCVDNQCQWS